MNRPLPRAMIFFASLILLMAIGASTCDKHAQAAQHASKDPSTQADSSEDLHIYLLIGQSNMAGRAKIADDMAGVIDQCVLLNDQNQWVPARNPLNLYSTIRKGEGMQKLGPGYGFTKAMLEANPDNKIGLVVNARGGSKIEQWSAKSKYYLDAVKRTRAAIESGGTLKGILWHQGESNSNNPEAYLEQLKTLIGNLRKDLGDADLPFIAGQVNNTPVLKINDVIASLPEAVPNTAVVSSEGLKCYDRWHFDTDSQIELGKRYAKALLKVRDELEQQDRPAR